MVSAFSFRFLQNMFFVLIGVLVMPIFYKKLGPENLGIVSFVESIATIFSIFAGFGIARFATREITQCNEGRAAELFIVSRVRKVSLWTHCFVNILYVITCFFFLLEMTSFSLMIFFISLFSLNRNIFNVDWFYEAHDKFSVISIKNIFLKFFFVFGLFFFIDTGFFLEVFYLVTGGFTFFSFFLTYLYFIFFEKQSFFLVKQKKAESTFELLKRLTPSVLLANSYLLYLQLDKIFLGGYDIAEAGYYSLAERIALLAFNFVMTLIVVSLPTVSRLYKSDVKLYEKKVEWLISLVFFMMLPSSVGMWLLAPYLVDYFGGTDFKEAVPVVQVFSVLVFMLAIWRVVVNHVFFVSGYEKICFFVIVFFGLINFLIKMFGSNIDAYKSVVITAGLHVLIIIVLFFIYRFFLDVKVRLLQFNYLKYLIASLAFIPVLKTLEFFHGNSDINIILMLLICPVSYVVILCILKDVVIIKGLKLMRSRWGI